MKRRQAKKIHGRWLKHRGGRLPWKKATLDRALDIWLWKRFLPDRVSARAW